MSEMVRRVAIAMLDEQERGKHGPLPASEYLRMARAAIAAMREPTEAMLSEAIASSGASDIRSPFWIDGWRAMIDAAMADTP